MDSLKFLGKPAPNNMSEDAWMDRCEYLEGAIKEAIELLEIPIIELDKKYVSKNGVAILLKETIGKRTKQ